MQQQNESFEISVTYNGKEEHFLCELNTYGYSYRIITEIDHIPVIFEPDEERNFRARAESVSSPGDRLRALVSLIGAELEKQFRD